MKQLLFITSILPLISYSAKASLDDMTKPTCAEMGYTTSTAECLSSNGNPLLCPYSDSDNSLCICLSKSCRGYPLLKDRDNKYYYLNTEGERVDAEPAQGSVEGNIEGNMESCTVGFGDDEVTYYRVPKCKSGFRYQNNIFDEGCDTVNKYPFDYHPGTLPGRDCHAAAAAEFDSLRR